MVTPASDIRLHLVNVVLRDRDEKADVTELPTVAMAMRRMKKSWRFIIVFDWLRCLLLLYGILNQIYDIFRNNKSWAGVVRTELDLRSWQGGVMVVLMGGEVSFSFFVLGGSWFLVGCF